MSAYKFIEAKFHGGVFEKPPVMIVIHWVAGSFVSAVNTFKDGIRKASAHFVVNVNGEVLQMVSLVDKAWHAGESFTNEFGPKANNYSIGIELAGPPSFLRLREWDERQIQATRELIKNIMLAHPSITYITDHSTISPGRKIDVKKAQKPEDIFPWKDLVEGLGLKEI